MLLNLLLVEIQVLVYKSNPTLFGAEERPH